MKNLKRALSFALATVMVIGMMVVGAGAAFTDEAKIANDEAVDVMVALGVISGKGDGSYFDPEATLTRAEAAKIITYMLLGKTNAEKLGKTGATFTDVPAGHWAETYIGYCANLGIISGYNGEFNPAGELTGLAFGKMLLTALGYDAAIEGYTGTTEWGINVAIDLLAAGIDLGDDVVLADALSRDNACEMAFQALTADVVEYGNKGTQVTINGAVISTGATEAKAMVNKTYSYDCDATAGDAAGEDGTMQFCEKYFPKLKVAADTDDFGRTSNYWFLSSGKDDITFTTDVDTKIGEYAETADYTVLVTRTDKNLDYWVDTVSKTFVTKNDTVTYLNGDIVSTTGDYDASYTIKLGDAIELFMDTDGKTIDKVVVTRYTADVVATNPDAEVSTADKENDVKYYTSFKTNGSTLDTEVPGFDAATYVKNAVVALAVKADGTILDSYVMKAVSGAITAYNAAGASATAKYTIDGKAYALNGVATDSAIAGTVDFAKGTYALYLDNNGYVLYTKVLTGSTTLDDVYYVVNKYYTNDVTFGATNNYKFYVQVVDMAGVVSTIEIDNTQYAGLVLAGTTTTANEDLTSKYVVSVAYNTGYTAGTGTNTVGTKYYTLGTAICAGLYSFEDVSGETYKKAVAYNPATGANLVGTFNQTAEIKATATDIAGYKVNADTKYILVKGSLSTLKVAVYTGGIAMSTFADNANEDIVVYTKDANGNKVASYIILLTTDNKQNATSYTDLLYCSTTTGTVVNKGVNTVMYNLKGEKVTVYTKAALGLTPGEFYKYNVDADGYYTFETAETEATWDTSFTKGVFLDEIYDGIYGTLMTTTEKLTDREAGNAKIVDLRSADAKADGVYTNTIDNLNKLHAAAQKGNVLFDAYATKANGVELIFVKSVTCPEPTSITWVTNAEGQYSLSVNFATATERVEAGKITVVLKDANNLVKAKTTSLRDITSAFNYIRVPFWAAARSSSSWDAGHQNLGADFLTGVATAEVYIYGALVGTYTFES